MKINISIDRVDDVLKISSPYNGKEVGTMYDHGVQDIIIERPPELANLNLRLFFKPKYGEWIQRNIGKKNKYTLTNALTHKDELVLQIAFFKGKTCRYGSNQIRFKFREGPRCGAIPKDLPFDYDELLEKGVIRAELSEDQTAYDFYKSGW